MYLQITEKIMRATAKITTKRRITLPKKIRQRLGVEEGSVMVFEEEDQKIVLRPARTLLDYQGFLKGKAKTTDFEEMRRIAKKHVGRRVTRTARSLKT